MELILIGGIQVEGTP